MIDRVIVLAECGHWWRESQPARLKLDKTAPRVCTLCRPTVRASVGTSPQGFAMVPVIYLPGEVLNG